jgi:hypothetical protein
MSRRIRSAEESARREQQLVKQAAYTLVADSTAPSDPRARSEHYKRHLVDAHRTIEKLQGRIIELEGERDKAKADKDYALSLCVTRTEAEDGRLAAFRLAREKAALLMEGPDSEPTARSEIIREIPDIKPKWTR